MPKKKSAEVEEGKNSGLQNPQQKSAVQISDIVKNIIDAYSPNGTNDQKRAAHECIRQYIKQMLLAHGCSDKYNIVIVFDPTIMVKSDADNIYSSVTSFQENKPLLLILHSNGGDAGAAYLIGKLCREYSNGAFIISVPRSAKSAATLLCCAADQIHLGSLSELGPIDPQINRMPALGLKHSIEHIAQMSKEIPESAEMFAKYLHYSLSPVDLGYYERVAQSAMQYAERLLETHSEALPKRAQKIAYELVYTYKDHGFVIDKTEAAEIFGKKIIMTNTDEYNLGNDIYKALALIESVASYMEHQFFFVGGCEADPHFKKVR